MKMTEVMEWIRNYLPDDTVGLTWEKALEHLMNNKQTVATVLISVPVLYLSSMILRAEIETYSISKAASKFPGLPCHWLLGHMPSFPGPNEKGLMYWSEQTKKHPRVWKFFYSRYNPSVTLCHPDTIKLLLKTAEPKPGTVNKFGGYNLMHSWLGDGLLTSKEELWFRDRRLLTPAFHFEILKPYMEVFNRSADMLLDQFSRGVQDGQSVEIFYYISLATLDTILKCAFSSDMDVQSKGEQNSYIKAVYQTGALLMDRFYSLPVLWNEGFFSMTAKGKTYNSGVKYMNDLADEVIRNRKKALKDSPDAQKGRHKDFLDILLLAKDDSGNGLNDTEIRFQVNTFLFEGHDTTASAISWCLYALAEHQEHQQKCREEIFSLLENSECSDLTWEMTSKAPYFTMCIKEAMRLHCPVPFVRRESTKAFTIDGIEIPAGCGFDIGSWCVHHNPDVWGEDHMKFKPARFEPDNLKEMDSFAYIPFSAGPRNCIGQHFAMNEIKTYLSKILSRFSLSVDDKHKVEYLPELVMRAKHGIKLYFHEL